MNGFSARVFGGRQLRAVHGDAAMEGVDANALTEAIAILMDRDDGGPIALATYRIPYSFSLICTRK
jgi:hypothetical protein